jgi:hypothetical protein
VEREAICTLLVESVKRVTDIMAEIMAASQEQSAGIEQVNQAIGQMDQVTQQNAALVEQASAAAESMQDQAARLAQVVGAFKLGGMRTAAAARPVRQTGAASPKARTAPVVKAEPKRIAQALPAKGGEWEQF